MPTLGTPRLGHRVSGSTSLYPISCMGFRQVKRYFKDECGVDIEIRKVESTDLELIQEAARKYLLLCKVFQDGVLWRDKKAALRKIIKHGKPFLEIFRGVDSSTAEMLTLEMTNSAGHTITSNRIEQLLLDEHEDTANKIDALIRAADKIISTRSGVRGGRWDRTPVKELCVDLKPIFEKITGSKESVTIGNGSPFVGFVNLMLKIIKTESGYRADALNLHIVADCAACIIRNQPSRDNPQTAE